MTTIEVKVKLLDHFQGELPQYETIGASGCDVRAQIRQSIIIKPGERALIPTGLVVEIPPGYEIQIRPRSGLALRQGLSILNTPGTIDADYRGEIKIILINLGLEPIEIKDQDRIAQMVLCPVTRIHWIKETSLAQSHRGSGGFGSTGV